jgi:high-affinity iron transporter
MLAAAIIVSREVLEASLIVGIVLAATKGIVGRGRWVGGGVVGGLALAALVAAGAGIIAAAIAGVGQELFNALVLIAAVLMLGWHNVWMGRHGRELAQQMKDMGRAVVAGRRPLHILAVVVGLAVLREGSEVVLFLYGVAVSQGISAIGTLLGSLLGVAVGGALGAILYFGLMRVPTRALFAVTGWLILLLSAGMAAQAANYLVRADLLPPLGRQLWDSSWLLRQDSLVGQVLHTLIGYVDRPSGLQLVAYLGTLAIIGGAMRLWGRTGTPTGAARPA